MRPRHAWYLNHNGYTQPYTADDWAFGLGLVGTADLTKLSNPKPWRFNMFAQYVYPLDLDETQVLVYSAGVNWLPKSWMDVFLEYSGEMRLQTKGMYKFEPSAHSPRRPRVLHARARRVDRVRKVIKAPASSVS